VLAFAGSCTNAVSRAEDPASVASAPTSIAISPTPTIAATAATPGPTSVSISDVPTAPPFQGARFSTSAGDTMFTTLWTTQPLEAGIRVSDLLADPGAYFETREMQDSSASRPPFVTLEWLSARPAHIVPVPLASGELLWTFSFAAEKFTEVLVATDQVADWTPFAALLADEERRVAFESVPTWALPSHAVPFETLDNGLFELRDLASCSIAGPVRPGDPIVFHGGWNRQVIRAATVLPAGLTAEELVSRSSNWITARVEFGCEGPSISSMRELNSLRDLVVLADVESGTNLSSEHFGPADELPPGMIVRPTPTPTPPRASMGSVYVATRELIIGTSMAQVLEDPASNLEIQVLPAEEIHPDAVRPGFGSNRMPWAKLRDSYYLCAVEQRVGAGEQLVLPDETERAMLASRPIAAGTTVGEIQTDQFAYLSTREVPSCGLEAGQLLRSDEFAFLDPTLVLHDSLVSGEPLRLEHFSPG